MIADTLTVMWKERKGLFHHRGSRMRNMLTLLSPVILAIYLPWATGPWWVDGPPSLLLAIVIPVSLVGITIPDSFAGERERHTLATLLATRLPDRAILFGKVAVAVAYAWGVTLIGLLLGLVTVNVVHWNGEILLYSWLVVLADLALSFLIATLMAWVGVLISLRSATVQEATQTLMAIFMIPPALLGVVASVFVSRIGKFIETLDGTQVLLVAVAVLVVANLGTFVRAMIRFQRARLMLD